MADVVKEDIGINKTWKHLDKIMGSSIVAIIFAFGIFYANSKDNDEIHDIRITAAENNIKELNTKCNNIVIQQAITPEQFKVANQRADRQEKDIESLKTNMESLKNNMTISNEQMGTVMDITLELYAKQTGRRYIPKK